MSKNLTLKGAAFGALVALSLASVAPASAAGLADKTYVSLAPKTGTEYTVLAHQAFDLVANVASLANAGKLKVLVEDTAAKTYADYNATYASLAALGSVNATTTAAVADVAVPSWTSQDSTTKRKSASDGTYVIETTAASSANRFIRLVSADTTATQSVKATAWIDSNDDGLIDATEYTSETREIKFIKASEVVPTVTVSPSAVGDAAITATIATVPVLNGEQVGSAGINGAFTRQGSALSVVDTSGTWSDTTKLWTVSLGMDTLPNGWTDIAQPGTQTTTHVAITNNVVTVTTGADHKLQVGDVVNVNATLARADNATATVTSVPSTTTYTYAVTTANELAIGVAANDVAKGADASTPTVVSLVRNKVSAGTYSVKARVASGIVASISDTVLALASKVTTVTATNTLAAGDVVTVAESSVDGAYEGTFAVASATASAFTYYVNAGDASGTVANTTISAVTTTAVGTAATVVVGSKTAAAVSADVVGSADAIKSATADTSNIRKGATSADVIAEVTNVDGKAVSAGVDVTATVTVNTGAGTFKVNGTTVATGSVIYAKTDAAGTAKFTVNNSLAAVSDSITLTINSEGNSASETLVWAAVQYGIYDLKSTDAGRVRAATKGASYTFDLLVQDQFKQPAGADFRIHSVITDRTVATANNTLSAGKFSLVVADGGLTTGDNTVTLTLEKLVSGVWTTPADADVVNWDGASGAGTAADLAAVTIKYYDQTDAIVLNADAANTPGTDTADLKATVASKALKAINLNTTNGNATAYAAAEAGVVAGLVKNSVTAVAKAGAEVTVSGSGLLFNHGNVWALNSITFIDADGNFAVNVYSSTSGDKTVTVTSGAVSATTKVAFTGSNTSVKKLTIAGTQRISAGSTLRADILLTDGNGNAIDTVAPAATPVAAYIKVIYDGPGLLSGSAIANETDADGKASVRYLLGTGDKGAATVTVKYDQNYDGDFVDATDIIVVREYLISVSAKIVKPAKGATATVKNALGATIKVVRGSKSTTKVATSNTQKVTLKSGTGKVNVYVNGIKVASK